MNRPDETNPPPDPRPDLAGEEPTLPPKLAEQLREQAERRVFVPPEVDQRIADEARAHLSGQAGEAGASTARRRRSAAWWLPRIATAAGLVIAIGILSREMGLPSRIMNAGDEPTPQVANEPLAGDIDGDGVVDIVDAYLIARDVAKTEAAGDEAGPTRWALDINEDGSVDRGDARTLAMRIVDLSKEAG